MRSVRVLSIGVIGLLLGLCSVVSAQSLGTFRWQLQPFCNVVTLAITQNGDVFRLEGADDQCKVDGRPAAIGTAFLNSDGSVALGLTLVGAPGGAPTHLRAPMSIATLGGTWQDSGGNTGAFVLVGLAGGGNTGDVSLELRRTTTGPFDLSGLYGIADDDRSTDTAAVTPAPCSGRGHQFQSSVPDVNMKEHFRDLDGDEMLAKIARMPVREWNYKAQDAAIRHIGPTAQDFYAAFGLGEDPLKISTIDADGVALRAIQALEARTRAEHDRMLEDTQSLADENESLVRENAGRIAEIATLKADIAALRTEMRAARQGVRR